MLSAEESPDRGLSTQSSALVTGVEPAGPAEPKNGDLRNAIQRIRRGQIKKVAAVPDIHGNVRDLDRVLTDIDAWGAEEKIFMGDYMDRDPAGLAALDRVRARVENGRATALAGNHEVMFIRAMLGDDRALGEWLLEGGDAVLREADIQMGCPLLDRDQRERLVHPGVNPAETQAAWLGEKKRAEIRANQRLRDAAAWMQKNLKIFHVDVNGTGYIHAGLPVIDPGVPLFRYAGKRGREALRHIQEDFRTSTNPQDPVWKALSEESTSPVWIRGWQHGLSVEGMERLFQELGVLRLVFAHTPDKDNVEDARKTGGRICGIDHGMVAHGVGGTASFWMSGPEGLAMALYVGSFSQYKTEHRIATAQEIAQQAESMLERLEKQPPSVEIPVDIASRVETLKQAIGDLGGVLSSWNRGAWQIGLWDRINFGNSIRILSEDKEAVPEDWWALFQVGEQLRARCEDLAQSAVAELRARLMKLEQIILHLPPESGDVRNRFETDRRQALAEAGKVLAAKNRHWDYAVTLAHARVLECRIVIQRLNPKLELLAKVDAAKADGLKRKIKEISEQMEADAKDPMSIFNTEKMQEALELLGIFEKYADADIARARKEGLLNELGRGPAGPAPESSEGRVLSAEESPDRGLSTQDSALGTGVEPAGPAKGPGRTASVFRGSASSDETAPAMRRFMPGYIEWNLANKLLGFVIPERPESSGSPAAADAESVPRTEPSASGFVPFRTWFKEVDWEKFVQRGAIVLDVDGNLLGRGETLDKYPAVREALAYLLRRGVRVVILSGNSYITLQDRVVAPLRRALREDTQALSRLTVYGNASTAKYQFDPTGQAVPAKDYGQEFTVTQDERNAVAEILREEGKDKFGLTEPQIQEWLAWYEKQWDVKKKHMKAPWAAGEPYDPPQLRDKMTQNKDGGDLVMPLVELRDQIISVLYLPGAPAGCAEVRPRLIERFRNDARLARLTRLFDIRAGRTRNH